jgi:ADP-heptose:LPS heptosyltransferase
MELLRNAEFLHGLGMHEFRARISDIQAQPDQIPTGLPSRPYAVLFPGAGWTGKRWPAERFIEVGRRLKTRSLNIVVSGGSADRDSAASIVRELGNDTIDLVEKTSLPQVVETIRGATLILANDTSAIHIAAAVGTPSLCILGGGHFGRFVPYPPEITGGVRHSTDTVMQPMACYGCNWKCIFPRHSHEAVKCIREISVEKVWIALEQILAKCKMEPRAENERSAEQGALSVRLESMDCVKYSNE